MKHLDQEVDIPIRGDFEAEATLLRRLWLIGAEFDKFNNEDWSHYRNREDFDRIYSLDQSATAAYERLYAMGRDCAQGMGWWLKAYNEVSEFPTLGHFICRINESWVDQQDLLSEVLAAAEEQSSLASPPFAVEMMVDIFKKQIEMLKGVRITLDMLEASDLYLLEQGKLMAKKDVGTINISTTGENARVNFQSSDNSVNISESSFSATFEPIRVAIEEADIQDDEKTSMLHSLGQLESSAGGSSFTDRYKEFLSTSANHMTILAPFLPSLALLL